MFFQTVADLTVGSAHFYGPQTTITAVKFLIPPFV